MLKFCAPLLVIFCVHAPLLAAPSAYGDDSAPTLLHFADGSILLYEPLQAQSPSSYAQLQGPQSLLLVASSPSNAAGFPTFNLLRLAGSFPAIGKPLSAQAEELASSYRKVGMANVEILRTPRAAEAQANSPIQCFLLAYQNGTQQMAAAVAIRSFAAEHYVLTWTDFRSNLDALGLLAEKMAASFQASGDDSDTNPRETEPISKSPLWWLLSLAAAALFLWILARFARR